VDPEVVLENAEVIPEAEVIPSTETIDPISIPQTEFLT